MSTQRHDKVQEAIRQEVSLILHNEIKDPRIGFITVTSVDLTKDLRYARVYFSVLGDAKANRRALFGLNSARGYVKGLLSEKIKLRFMPEIEFKIDRSLERTQKIYDILEDISKEKEKNETDNRGDKEE